MSFYNQLVKQNDQNTEKYMKDQVLDRNSRYFGGVIDQKTGIPSPSHTGTGSVIGAWVSSYVNSDSIFYQNEELKKNIGFALDYMLAQQHDDGTISPGWTNYHSPPDTAFLVTGFAQVYQLLHSTRDSELTEKMEWFLRNTIPAMITGGCHTPNHRWVLASALANLYAIYHRDDLKERAEEWLAEGIDISEDGEWTERSNGIYNSVSNICLYHTAVQLEKPELLDYVRKNLNMMMYLVHPNGQVVTDYSGRQDLAHTYDLSPYHLIYRLMAVHDNNEQYMAMANLAFDHLSDIGPVNNHIMLGYLSFPSIQHTFVDSTDLPTEYEVFINENYPLIDNLEKMEEVGHHSKIEHSSMHTSFAAPIVRYRDKERSATIMGRNSSFFSLHNGDASLLGVQLYNSFSPGIVEFDKIERINGGYRLSKELEKGYTGPIPKKYLSDSDTSIWYLLPHQYRMKTHNQKHVVTVDITRENDEWYLHIRSDNREDVFYQVVFIFHPDTVLEGSGLEEIEGRDYFWKSNGLQVAQMKNKLMLEDGNYEHWQKQLGQPMLDPKTKSVKVNLISPIDKSFKLMTN
ncbi:hypothetical protein [Gracilibacillus sp. YIM 98692]|uniref:hypothetical protein n=1 Tax=Gracilibacillus sp. YIM 98692 TaxID=2663532 RepID=UPI0013D070F5|nr:hypothetical protein [Gracilibacillus sp. YIM 98692]